jgi:hypothetical protein
LLGLDVGQIQPGDNFFDLGGNSLLGHARGLRWANSD